MNKNFCCKGYTTFSDLLVVFKGGSSTHFANLLRREGGAMRGCDNSWGLSP